jgi:hypothetical protein
LVNRVGSARPRRSAATFGATPVANHLIGAEGPDQIHLGRAAHAGDLGTEGLDDLDGEGPHTARGADDQHLFPGLHVAAVTDTL